MPRAKRYVWEWDGCVGVRGCSSVEEARAFALGYLYDNENESTPHMAEMVRDNDPQVWAVPGIYFRSDSGDSWGESARMLRHAGEDTPAGYAKVLWWRC